MAFSRGSFRYFSTFLAVLVLSLTAACSKKAKEDEGSSGNAPLSDENVLGDSDSGKAMGLQTIHFAFDSFTLDENAKATIKANADIMKDKSSIRIQLEGHCDQRGGIQYNIALGEKRANATKKYMEDMGISSDRMTTISYGKERLIDTGESEEAYAKNRRSNFVITSR